MTIIPSKAGNIKSNSVSGNNTENNLTLAVGSSKDRNIVNNESLATNTVKVDHIRPSDFSQYLGQSSVVKVLQTSIKAAKVRNEALDHVLFYGPPGLGKTSLAFVMANELGSKCFATSAKSLERPKDILGLLCQLGPNDILFIDEIHGLSKTAEELLYEAMEDFCLTLTTGKGQTTRSIKLPLPKFTLIGATTRVFNLCKALRDRFVFSFRLDFYNTEELSKIVDRASLILKVKIDNAACLDIAKRARGTPRIAIRLIKMVRDFSQELNQNLIDKDLVNLALSHYKVDEYGLDDTDRKFLKILIQNFKGGPVGIEAIAQVLGEDIQTLQTVCEPYLIQAGFLIRTPRGRTATKLAYEHIL